MPVVLVVARDWKLRASVRAELREMGVDALGMDSVDEVKRAIAPGGLPSVMVVEALAEFLGDSRIQDLVRQIPAILIAPRTVNVSLPEASAVIYRPVRVADIIVRVRDLLAREHAG